MTEEAKRVVAGLRYCYRHIACYDLRTGEKCPDYDSCQKKVADNVSRNESLADLIESLCAELEQVKRERDALMDELRGRCYSCANVKPYEKIPRMNVCEHIKVAFSGEWKRGCEYWQWRGVKEEKDER